MRAASKVLGKTSQVLDIHDGELLPTLENRRTLTRLIREWKADLVILTGPNDYHPDHRYVGVLVQDSAFMVTVPFFCPDTPYLAGQSGVPLYYDSFLRPNPFRARHVVSIDSVIEELDALLRLESQFVEGGANTARSLSQTPAQRGPAPQVAGEVRPPLRRDRRRRPRQARRIYGPSRARRSAMRRRSRSANTAGSHAGRPAAIVPVPAAEEVGLLESKATTTPRGSVHDAA